MYKRQRYVWSSTSRGVRRPVSAGVSEYSAYFTENSESTSGVLPVILYALVELSHPSFLKNFDKSALAVDENRDTDGKFIHAPSFFVFLLTFSTR